MKLLSKGAVLAGAGALLLGGGLALSSARVVLGETVKPDKSKIICAKSTYCFEADNTGSGYGLQGVAAGGRGVEGFSTSGYGIFGYSSAETGVYGVSAAGYAGIFESYAGYGPGLLAQNDGGGNSLEAVSLVSGSATGSFYVNGVGDGFFSGNVYTDNAVINNQRTREGGHEATFGTQSTRATLEDTGTARLTNGEAAVRFDPAFAGTLDFRQGYQVLITPDGETRGLYVAAKYEGGFFVRENERGRSNVDFDYRVVAHPIGQSDARLPRLNLKAPAIPNLKAARH
jgi:hypothetical protein